MAIGYVTVGDDNKLPGVVLGELDRTYAPVEQIEPVLLQQAATSKGGVIGIGDKGAIAIRFDDWHVDFKANIYDLMVERGLPYGYATISRFSEQDWAAPVTTAEFVSWMRNGGEAHSHGTNHKDPSPQGDAGLIDQIVNSKAEIESWGLKCQGWMQPGATPVGEDTPYGSSLNDISQLYNTRAGRLIRRTYPISEMYMMGAYRDLPYALKHGLNHITISDGMGYQSIINTIDYAVANHLGLELMVHSGNIGDTGSITLAQYTDILDHLVSLRDSGTAEILTPSGLQFADHSNNRVQLLRDTSFEGMATGDLPSTGAQWSMQWDDGATIETTGGRTGSNFLRIPSAESALAVQRATFLQQRGFGGETFVFSGWCRSVTDSWTNGRVLIQDYDDTTRLNLNLTGTISPGAEWVKREHAFTLHPDTDVLSIAIGRNSGAGIEWDDISVRKV